jgi:hypothetical protein
MKLEVTAQPRTPHRGVRGCAVEIACTVENDTSHREVSIAAQAKKDEN